MTNEQIIINEALTNGIFTEEQVEEFVRNGVSIPLHTAEYWKRQYKCLIKKGEKATVTTMLWKKKKRKTDEEDLDQEAEEFYLAKSHLFTIDQVEKMREDEQNEITSV